MPDLNLLFLYLRAFWPHWWPIVVTGALFGVDRVVSRVAPPAHDLINMIPATTRRTIEVVAIMLAIFYAGYSAWSEEHASAVAAFTDRDIALGQLSQAMTQNDHLRDEARKYVPRHLPVGFAEKMKVAVDSDVLLKSGNVSFIVGGSADNDSASLSFELIRALKAAGLQVYSLGLGAQVGKEVGYVFYVVDPNAPSPFAAHLLSALEASGIKPMILPWTDREGAGADFNIFVTRDTPMPD